MKRFTILLFTFLLLLGAAGCKKQYVGQQAPWYAYEEINQKGDTTEFYRSFEHYYVTLHIKKLGAGHYSVTGNAEAVEKDPFLKHGKQEFRLYFVKNFKVVDTILLNARRFNDVVTLSKEFTTDPDAKDYQVSYRTEYFR